MPSDLRFTVANTPGAIAEAARALGNAGINIDGIGCDIRPGDQWGFIHFLVDDAEGAKRALASVGCEVQDIHDVDVVDAEDRPGALAEICQSYTDRGENIEVLYLGMNSRVVVGTENMRRPIEGRSTAEATYSDTRTEFES